MLKQKLETLFLVICLLLTGIPTALAGTPTPPVIYVSGDGTGDFNCDGKDDHVQINQALKFVAENSEYTTVYLKGPFTYTISDSVLIGSNTILEGDSDAVIKLASNVGWPSGKAMIEQLSSSGNHDITIRNFVIDGNKGGNPEPTGYTYHNFITLFRCSNVAVHDMRFQNGKSDALKILSDSYDPSTTPTNIKFYNNIVTNIGHDGLYVLRGSNVEAYNNVMGTRTNSAFRMFNTNHVKIHDNEIHAEGGSGAGIEIEKYGTSVYLDDIEIYNNLIYSTCNAAIWLESRKIDTEYPKEAARNVHIHHNIIHDSSDYIRDVYFPSGIMINGWYDTLIENNVLDGGYGPGISHTVIEGRDEYNIPGTGYNTIVRNNIISNTKNHPESGWPGAGLWNALSDTHSFESYNNCFYNNAAGDYLGDNIFRTDDIYTDPMFADRANYDYHLKSTAGRWDGMTWVTDSVKSPCIDAGYPGMDYSNEPEDNGDRINIGAYGNTEYASKSFLVPVNNAPVMFPIGDKTVQEGETLSFTVKAEDPDGDTLTYSASNLPQGARLYSSTGTFIWTPEAGQAGIYTLEFKVSDGELTASQEATINVSKEVSPVKPSGKIYDNRLREASPTKVYTDKYYIDVGGRNGVGSYRDLIWFDLSGYDNAEAIGKATLSLFWYYPEGRERAQDTIVEIYRPDAWNPDYVSWNNRDLNKPWEHAGGDWYDRNNVPQGSTPYATITIKGSDLPDNSYHELDVTELVKEYVSGEYENTGFLIKARTESGDYIAFYSSDCGIEECIPKLDVKMKPETEVLVLSNLQDSRLREGSPDTVFNDVRYIDLGGRDGVGGYRDLVMFDLSELDGAEIESAVLSLFWYYPAGIERPEDTVVEIYRPEAWNPGYVTWNSRDLNTPWVHAGGDWYDLNNVPQGSTPYATMTIKGSDLPDNSYHELDVTELVKEYVSGEHENTGLLIKARTERGNYMAFYSSEVSNENQRPKMDIIYRNYT